MIMQRSCAGCCSQAQPHTTKASPGRIRPICFGFRRHAFTVGAEPQIISAPHRHAAFLRRLLLSDPAAHHEGTAMHEELQATYGPAMLRFRGGSWDATLREAAQTGRQVLLYIHAPDHEVCSSLLSV